MRKPISLSMTFVLLLTLLGGLFSTPLPASADEQPWYAEYFANMTLSGSPAVTEYESDLTQYWGTGSPNSSIPADGFSARYSKDIWFDSATYRFTFYADDGLRLWINDVLVIDYWGDHSVEWKTQDFTVSGGTGHVRIEYYEHWGEAAMRIGWEKLQSDEVWQALYWNNTSHSGNAVMGRRDGAIDFDWGTGSPDSQISTDGFSARWSRTMGFEAGTYRIYASSDDGVRIYVDGQKVIDKWITQELPNTHYGDITLAAGTHTVVVEYFEQGGEAAIHVWWNRIDSITGWEGRYYDNLELRGAPAMIRDDAEINFNWGDGAPGSWMPNDNFSVQWVRTINLPAGLYRFNAWSDDGIRLWIDDVDLRLDHWEPQTLTWNYQDWHWLEGAHTLRVEYFDGTGAARVQFWWDYAATVEAARAMAPSSTYRSPTVVAPTPSAAVPAPTIPSGTTGETTAVQLLGPWQGEYFATRDMTKAPVLVRSDAAIDFDWKWDSPAEEIPVNQFAVRWTGNFTVGGGRYRLTTTTDDGVRVYVDDKLVLNSWYAMRGSRSATVQLTAGQHTVRMEYFEATQAAKAKLTWQRLGL